MATDYKHEQAKCPACNGNYPGLTPQEVRTLLAHTFSIPALGLLEVTMKELDVKKLCQMADSIAELSDLPEKILATPQFKHLQRLTADDIVTVFEKLQADLEHAAILGTQYQDQARELLVRNRQLEGERDRYQQQAEIDHANYVDEAAHVRELTETVSTQSNVIETQDDAIMQWSVENKNLSDEIKGLRDSLTQVKGLLLQATRALG